MSDGIVWCHYCGKNVARHRDHVIPRSAGGPNASWNRLPSCWPCDRRKGASSYEDFTGRPLPAHVQAMCGYPTTAAFKAATSPRVRPPRTHLPKAKLRRRYPVDHPAWVPPERLPYRQRRLLAANYNPNVTVVDHPAWVDPRP